MHGLRTLWCRVRTKSTLTTLRAQQQHVSPFQTVDPMPWAMSEAKLEKGLTQFQMDIGTYTDAKHVVTGAINDDEVMHMQSTTGVEQNCASVLCCLRQELASKQFIFIPGIVYRELLLAFGATKEDLNAMESGAVHNEVAHDMEPSMSFRQVAFHRMLLEMQEPAESVGNQDLGKDHTIPEVKSIYPARKQAVTQILDTEIASTGADFKRSGTRYWNMPPRSYAHESTVPMSRAKLHSVFLPAKHHAQKNIKTKSTHVINDQILIKITRNATLEEAEPTPEGRHQDGSEISVVTLIERVNVVSGGESRIWTLECEKGKTNTPDEENDLDKCLFGQALTHPWDTILFNDREVSHDVVPFEISGDTGSRSVIVDFIRMPLSDGADSI